MQDTSSTVDALLTLLGDEDSQIVNTAEKQLLEMGDNVLPFLKARLSSQPRPVKSRVKNILEQLEPRKLKEEFRSLPVDSETNELRLEEALYTLAKIGFPDFTIARCRSKLDELAAELEAELARWESIDDHTTVEVVKEILFDKYGFEGSKEDYYNPNNNFINWNLERKTGSPLALCCLVRVVTRRIDLPFEIIGMPAHAILAYRGKKDRRLFMDPFHNGRLLSREDCKEFLDSAGFGFVEEYLQPISNKKIILRLLRNLINTYHRNHSSQRVKELRSYLAIVDRRY